jgi:hypothetical protein
VVETANWLEWIWVVGVGASLGLALYLSREKTKDAGALEVLGENGRKRLLQSIEQVTEIVFVLVLFGYEVLGLRALLSPSPQNQPTETQAISVVLFLMSAIAIGAREVYTFLGLRRWAVLDRERRIRGTRAGDHLEGEGEGGA